MKILSPLKVQYTSTYIHAMYIRAQAQPASVLFQRGLLTRAWGQIHLVIYINCKKQAHLKELLRGNKMCSLTPSYTHTEGRAPTSDWCDLHETAPPWCQPTDTEHSVLCLSHADSTGQCPSSLPGGGATHLFWT